MKCWGLKFQLFDKGHDFVHFNKRCSWARELRHRRRKLRGREKMVEKRVVHPRSLDIPEGWFRREWQKGRAAGHSRVLEIEIMEG